MRTSAKIAIFPTKDLEAAAERLAPHIDHEQLRAQRQAILSSLGGELAEAFTTFMELSEQLPPDVMAKYFPGLEASFTRCENAISTMSAVMGRLDAMYAASGVEKLTAK